MINQYIAAGWSLVPMRLATKGPTEHGWQQKGAAIKSYETLPPRYIDEGMNVGLMHAHCGTCAFDIDDWEETKKFGIDVDALYNAPDAVTILSGKEGHGKLLYRMPFGIKLPTKRHTIQVDAVRGVIRTRTHVVFELRCGTAEGSTVQDVLPPSIHPDTQQPYQWGGAGHWSRLPVLPTQLLKVWQQLIAEDEHVPSTGGKLDVSLEDVKVALSYISPNCGREEWIQVGMALHWLGEQTDTTDQTFVLWDEWSQRTSIAGYYPGLREMRTQWQSFRTSKGIVVTIATLYHMATQRGWVRPAIDAASLFADAKPLSPSDISASIRPAPPDIDLSLFPSVLARRATEVGRSVGCDPIVPLWAGLAAVCGVIDARSRLHIVDGFEVPPVLWLMTVGDPADKKSPGSWPMLDGIKSIEADSIPAYKQEQLLWEFKHKQWSVAKKAMLDYAGTPEGLLSGMEDAPQVPAEPPIPKPVKITCQDVTSAALVGLASARPRGLLCHLDEMNSWVNKIANPISGEDRSAWVVAYESKRYENHRVSTGENIAENFAVSIYGNIQPRVLRENFSRLTADGLLQRFLPALMRHSKDCLGEPMPAAFTNATEWDTLLRVIFAQSPKTYRLSHDVYQNVYREFQKWYVHQKGNERLIRSSDTFLTAFGKLEGLAGRLILLFHVMENPHNLDVSADVVERVIKLVKQYIIPAYRHLLDEDGSMSTFDAWLTDYILQHADEPSMTLARLRPSCRRPFDTAGVNQKWQQEQWIIATMYQLEQQGWVKRIDDGSKESQGKADWLINPSLKTIFKDHRLKVIKAKKEVRDYINSFNGMGNGRVAGQDLLDEAEGQA